jgi:septal ring factor EnvC (AmiA/AmiB activator)
VRRTNRIIVILAGLAAPGVPALARDVPVAVAQQLAADPDAAAADQRLRQLEQQLDQSRAEREVKRRKAQDLADELNGIRSGMVAAARAAQESEDQLSELEGQLADLNAAEVDKSEALKRRSAQMTGVLTALQRLAWRPTEALIAQPQSPADTVRSAILLRAAVPEIMQSAKTLRSEIDMLANLREDIVRQKAKIAQTTAKLEDEHRRLKDLFERKAQVQTVAQAEQAEVEQRLQQLANQAEDLRDLLARLDEERQRRLAEAEAKAEAERAAREAELAARHAAEQAEAEAQKAARDAEIANRKAEKERHERETAQAEAAHEAELKAQAAAREKEIAAQQASRDADRAARAAAAARPAAPDRSFSQAHGRMPFPARGKVVATYGETGDDGRVMKGISILTRKDAQVVAPYDGQVAFAGPFRGYGLLLIIEHSEGYHTLLAGMARIDVSVGQHLLAGEPVGVMGQDEAKPALYVELRRNGQPVNPLPWLTAHTSKVTG